MFARAIRKPPQRFSSAACWGLRLVVFVGVGLFSLLLVPFENVAAQAPVLQAGDLLVGAAQGVNSFGELTGPAVFRIRNGVATVFCEPGPVFFFIPEQVMVDSAGRVVFLAYLGSPYARHQGYGLFRCDTLGAAPELLAVFSGSVGDTRTPNPYPNDIFDSVGSLYLIPQKEVVIDENANSGLPQVVEQDVYGMLGAMLDPGTGQRTGFQSMRYLSASGTWEAGPQPVQASATLPDMVYHAGLTYTVADHQISRIEEPLRVAISGSAGNTPFGVQLSLFASSKEIGENCLGNCSAYPIIADDENIPNIDSGCNSQDQYPNLMPYESGFVPISGLSNVIFDEQGALGLVISSDYAPLTPYLTEVNDALINDDPLDDAPQYFHQPYLGCAAVPSLHYRRILPFYASDPALPGFSNSVAQTTGSLASTWGGVMGTGNGQVFHIVAGDHVEVVTNTLLSPAGIGGYPSVVASSSTETLIVQIDSPINVLVTDPTGKRLGDDPSTGQPVNDFGVNGFNEGQSEPRFLAIKNPVPGSYSLHTLGAGSGPYTIHIYAVSLAMPAGHHISVSGVTNVGAENDHAFTLGADTALAFNTLTSPCSAGTFSPTGSEPCTQAPAGSYVSAGGATQAIPCPPGSFQPNVGSTACNLADPGSYVGETGAVAETPCPAGAFAADPGSTACAPAPAGSFVAASGATQAIPCPPGSFQPNVGSTACNLADPGSFVSVIGAAAETPCPAGAFAADVGSTSCTPSPAGSFVAATGAVQASLCPPGSYQPNPGQASCILADPGFFVSASGAAQETACPMGTTSDVSGSTACHAISPLLQINQLMDAVAGLHLLPGMTQSLNTKLAAAYAALNAGRCETAASRLLAFRNEVMALPHKLIARSQADALVTAAEAILAALPCGCQPADRAGDDRSRCNRDDDAEPRDCRAAEDECVRAEAEPLRTFSIDHAGEPGRSLGGPP